MKLLATFIVLFYFSSFSFAQLSRDSIQTDFVLYKKRVSFDNYMKEKTINETFKEPLDSNYEYQYETACWAISQFILRTTEVKNGLTKVFAQYDSLQYSTKRALLEAAYGVYPKEF